MARRKTAVKEGRHTGEKHPGKVIAFTFRSGCSLLNGGYWRGALLARRAWSARFAFLDLCDLEVLARLDFFVSRAREAVSLSAAWLAARLDLKMELKRPASALTGINAVKPIASKQMRATRRISNLRDSTRKSVGGKPFSTTFFDADSVWCARESG
jgi:hypothetical protein